MRLGAGADVPPVLEGPTGGAYVWHAMRLGSVATVSVTALALGLAAAASGGHAKSAFIGPYTGVATGSRSNFRHLDNQSTDPKTHVVSDSNDEYHGRFTYSFRVENGVVNGIGNGDYQSATWHLQGVNGDQGAFSCDIPVHTQPFSARITGYAAGGMLFLRFELNDDAVERNDA